MGLTTKLGPAAAVLALVCALGAEAHAQVERRVGVVVTLAVNVEPAEKVALSAALGEALRAELPVDTISGEETERRMPPEGVPEECVADSTCRNNLGRRLDADELLMLVVVRMGDEVQVDASWADVASGRVTSRPRVTIKKGDDMGAVFREAAKVLLPNHVKKETKPNDRIVVVTPGNGAVAQPSGGRRMTLPAWIAVGVGGAALIGGGVFGLSARQKYNNLQDDDCDIMPCDPGEVDALANHALAADILFGVAAASAVTAVVFYLMSDEGTEKRPATDDGATPPVTIQASGDAVGVSIGGRF